MKWTAAAAPAPAPNTQWSERKRRRKKIHQNRDTYTVHSIYVDLFALNILKTWMILVAKCEKPILMMSSIRTESLRRAINMNLECNFGHQPPLRCINVAHNMSLSSSCARILSQFFSLYDLMNAWTVLNERRWWSGKIFCVSLHFICAINCSLLFGVKLLQLIFGWMTVHVHIC